MQQSKGSLKKINNCTISQ